MKSETHTFYGMAVSSGRIRKIFKSKEAFDAYRAAQRPGSSNAVDLKQRHVYPCLLDGHIHMLLTIASMAMGFPLCTITEEGVKPDTLAEAGEKLRSYAAAQKEDSIVAASNFIPSAMDEKRMPTKEELDLWGGGRPVVVYSIDGHSTALSSAMLRLIGMDPDGCGVLTGEENERAQGRITDQLAKLMGPEALARGIARFHDTCAEYGISMVGALEGNGDSPKDQTTHLIARLARHFDLGVRLYLQYTDRKRVRKFESLLKNKRAGGCGDWEMDGSCGSHSAAFYSPYKDTGKTAGCYFKEIEIRGLAKTFSEDGFQLSSHAIGDAAIDRLLDAYDRVPAVSPEGLPNRIEHCEFPSEEAFQRLCKSSYAVMVQPGYSWIDKRYLHSYENVLSSEQTSRMKLKSLFDTGVTVCGSSDSPVQDLDPYLQMLGMTQFYVPSESITPYEAMVSYTRNAAFALGELQDRGTLEPGKIADFFTADRNFFELKPGQIPSFRPIQTYYQGLPYEKKKGTVLELAAMLLSAPKAL